MFEGRRERKRRRTEALVLSRVDWYGGRKKRKEKEKDRGTLYPRRVVSKDMCVNCVGWSWPEYYVTRAASGRDILVNVSSSVKHTPM